MALRTAETFHIAQYNTTKYSSNWRLPFQILLTITYTIYVNVTASILGNVTDLHKLTSEFLKSNTRHSDDQQIITHLKDVKMTEPTLVASV